MLNLVNMVSRMADQRFVQPLEKGLLNDYSLDVDVKSIVPKPVVQSESIGTRSSSWWLPVFNSEKMAAKVFESVETMNADLCKEVELLKCADRCCMNWTMYDNTSCITSKSTSCNSLHQMSLCNQTLKALGDSISVMTEWEVHFIMCESVSSLYKEPMHLNSLDSLVDSGNILVLNPNDFVVTIILQEKSNGLLDSRRKRPKSKGRKLHRTGCCQMSINIMPRKVICLSDKTILNWNIYSVSSNANYILCVMGRYDLNNWLIKSMLDGKKLCTYTPI